MNPPPVLLVHGFATSYQRTWLEAGWVDLLNDAGRTCIPYDLPGHGEREKSHDPADYADLEGDLAEVVVQHQRLDAVGFSLGARTLLGVASDYPQRFGRIVVGGVGANLFRPEDGEALARVVEGNLATEDAMALAFARFAQGPGSDPLALAAVLRRPQEPMTAQRLGRVTIPVLVVLGDQDFAGPSDELVNALPDARLVTLKGVDHFRTADHFGFIDASLNFLEAGAG
ncbi:MAG: alpha/beta fold hydrolase [Acidimicrobiales bacterium]